MKTTSLLLFILFIFQLMTVAQFVQAKPVCQSLFAPEEKTFSAVAENLVRFRLHAIALEDQPQKWAALRDFDAKFEDFAKQVGDLSKATGLLEAARLQIDSAGKTKATAERQETQSKEQTLRDEQEKINATWKSIKKIENFLPGGLNATVALSDKGRYLFASSKEPAVSRLIDLSTQNEIHLPFTKKDKFIQSAFIPGSSSLVVLDIFGKIQIFDIQTNSLKPLKELHAVAHFSIAPDGSRLIAVGAANLQIVNLTNLTLVPFFLGNESLKLSAISLDGERLAVQNSNAEIKLIDLKNLKVLNGFSYFLTSEAKQMIFTADHTKLVVGESGGRVLMMNMLKLEGASVLYQHNSSVETLTVSPDGQYAVSGSRDGETKLYDFNTQQEIDFPFKSSTRITSMSFADDGELFVVSKSGIKRIDTLMMGEKRSLDLEWDGWTVARLSADLRTFVAINRDGHLIVLIHNRAVAIQGRAP